MTKRILAILIACVMALSLTGCGKTAAVKETERLIDAIGTVTAESVGAVEAAEAAYSALSDEEKNDVKNYSTLESARSELDTLLLESLRAAMVGTWVLNEDVTQSLADRITPQFSDQELSFGDYLAPCGLRIALELDDDGAYRLTVDESTLDQMRRQLQEAARACTEEYFLRGIAAELKKTGIEGDFSTREGIETAMGKTLDEVVLSTLGMGLDEYATGTVENILPESTELNAEGRYLVQPDMLYLSDTPDREPDGTKTAAFRLTGDILTLEVEQPVFGLTSLEFHRAG